MVGRRVYYLRTSAEITVIGAGCWLYLEPLVQSKHINIWRLTAVFFVSIAIPLLVGWVLDQFIPSPIPMLMLAAIVSIPIVAFTVSRAVLGEMKRVIELVAPPQVAEEADVVKSNE